MRRKSSGSLLPDIPDIKNHPAIVKKKYKELITIHPDSLRNLKESLRKELEKYVNKWRELYKGVLLDVRYVELNSSLGEIHDEYPYIHCEVLYGARIFRPEKGTQLVGTITQLFPSQIGLLVFGLYNCLILQENFGKQYVVDDMGDIVDKKTGDKVDVGEEITFTVESVQADSEGVFTIYGTLKKPQASK